MALGKHRASIATTREATSDPDISTLGSTLKRGAMLSALALGLVQVVSFVQTLILARILDPEQIGLYAAGTVLMGFLLGFSEGGLRGALIQREGDVEDAADTVFWVTFVSGLGLALLSLATAPLVGMVFKSDVAGTIAAVSSGAVVLHALTNVPDGLMQRRFNFKRRLIVDPTRVLGYAVVTITLAVLGFGVWSMVIGNYVGIAIWLFLSWRYARWRPGVGKFSFTLWRQMAAYAAPLLVEGIVERVRTAAETALIGRRLDANTLGQYRYGVTLAQLPSLVIVQIGSYVLFPAFSRLQSDPPRFARAFERALQVTWVGAAPFAGLMIAVGEPAVVVLLGEKWREAGVALMVMAGYGVGIALQAVGSEVIKAVGASKMLNWTTATSLVLGIGTLVALLPLGLIGVGIAMSITEIAVGIVVLILSRRVVKFSVGRLAWMLVPPAIAAAVAMAATWWLDRNTFGADEHGVILGILLLVLETIIFAIIYLAVLTAIAPKLGRSMIGAVMNKVRRGGGDEDGDEDDDEDDDAGVGAGPGPTGPDRELVGAGAAPGASEMTIQLPPMTASGMIGLARQVISEGLDDATVQMRLIQPMPTVKSRNRSERKLPLAPLPQRTSADDGRNATDETIVMKAVTVDGTPVEPAETGGAERTGATPAAAGVDLFSAPDDSVRDATVTSDGRRWSGTLESLRPTGGDRADGAEGAADAGDAAASLPADPEATQAQPPARADAEATAVTRSVTPTDPAPAPPGAATSGRDDAPRRPSPRPRPTPLPEPSAAQPPGDSSATTKVPAAGSAGGPGAGTTGARASTGGPAPAKASGGPASSRAPQAATNTARPGSPGPAAAAQSGPGTTPGAGTPSGTGTPPATGAQPGSGAKPATGAQTGSGATSGASAQPASTGSPSPTVNPVKPGAGTSSQAKPAQGTRPPGEPGPGTAQQTTPGKGTPPAKPASSGARPTGDGRTGTGPTTGAPAGSPAKPGPLDEETRKLTARPPQAPTSKAPQKPRGTGGPGTNGAGDKGAGANGRPSNSASGSGPGTNGSPGDARPPRPADPRQPVPSGSEAKRPAPNGAGPNGAGPNGAQPKSLGPNGTPPRNTNATPATGGNGSAPKGANGSGPGGGDSRDDRGPAAPRRPSPRPRPRPTPSDGSSSS